MSHVRVTRMRDVSGQKCDCMYIKFYAPNIAHRRSISPPTIMDRFKIQLKTSLILERKMTSDDFGARGRGAKIVSLASRSETPVRRFLAAAAAHICAA